MAEQVTRRPFAREVPKTRWFLHQPRYLKYMAREVTCIFIAIYTVILVIGFARLAQGKDAYDQFLLALASPWSVAFHVVALVFALYHSFTWFNLAPKALPLHFGERKVPEMVIAGAHYLGWIVVSLALMLLAGAF